MSGSRTEIIAEVKTVSPFGWPRSELSERSPLGERSSSREAGTSESLLQGWRSPHTWDELFTLAERVGDVISIHTDPRWHGSFELIEKARRRTRKPILAKGIHASDADIEKALGSGADWVLVVGRIPKVHLQKCWIEPTSIEQLTSLPPGTRAVWNSRDLKTGGRKLQSFKAARRAWDGWLVQASHVRTPADVDPAADAVLVGTHLPEFAAALVRKPGSI